MGRTERKFVGVISKVERMRNSAAGNPRHRVFFHDGAVHATGVDSQVGFNMVSRAYQRGPVEVTLNDKGQIIHLITV